MAGLLECLQSRHHVGWSAAIAAPAAHTSAPTATPTLNT
jgi:hypothetical protein